VGRDNIPESVFCRVSGVLDEAYVFCSLACDLRVTQLVDGNKGIHAMVRRDLLA